MNYYNNRFKNKESKDIFVRVFLDGIITKQFEFYIKRNIEVEGVELKKNYLTIYIIFGDFDKFIKVITLEFREFNNEYKAE